MGPCHAKRGKGNNAKNKHFQKYVVSTKHRAKDVDQVYDELAKLGREAGATELTEAETAPRPFDEDLPGGGQYYCVETARYFVSADALERHKRSKQFKQRVKELRNEAKYTQDDAEAALGKRKEVLPPVHSNRMED